MHLITRNVNTAFRQIVSYFNEGNSFNYLGGHPQGHVRINKTPSRNGNVLVIDEPVLISYTHPRERVLFNAARDANPFFHLYEALWMLAGRNDVNSVAYYAKQVNEYSDDGKTLNGAYGHRWRHADIYNHSPFLNQHGPTLSNVYDRQEVDQLDLLVAHLKADPNSRRAVLQMWNVEDDLLKIGGTNQYPAKTITQPSKDVCCNLSVMFNIRTLDPNKGEPTEMPIHHYLDMTVTNRSNDMVWGMLGANYVHFSFLQEYMAARLGCEVGKYHHFTNNLHVYDWNWKPEEWLNDRQQDWYGKGVIREHGPITNIFPLVKDPAVFEKELPGLVGNAYGGGFRASCPSGMWSEPFFTGVAGPVFRAFEHHKEGDHVQALRTCESIAADDWRIACTNWLERRKK